MSKGGFRPAAGRPIGRPKGSRDRKPRRPRRGRIGFMSPEAEKTWAEACAEYVNSGRAWQFIEECLGSEDERMRAWGHTQAVQYGAGLPRQKVEVSAGKSPEDILREIALRAIERRRLSAIDTEEAPQDVPESRLLTSGRPNDERTGK